MTTAYHVYWSAPARARHNGRHPQDPFSVTFALEELITLVHGIYSWRSHGGSFDLVTDEPGLIWAERSRVTTLYDNVHTWLTTIDTQEIDPTIYFSAGKFELFRRATGPFAIMDTDFYLRSPLNPPKQNEFLFSHWERTTSSAIYPEPTTLPTADGYTIPQLDYGHAACNMSFAWFGDPLHAQALGHAAFAFARNNNHRNDTPPIQRCVFAEQRLAPSIARKYNISLRPITSRIWDTGTGLWEGETQADFYHHTWFQKTWFTTFPELRASYCHYLIRDLCLRHPDGAEWLAKHLPEGLTKNSIYQLLRNAPVPHAVITDWRMLPKV